MALTLETPWGHGPVYGHGAGGGLPGVVVLDGAQRPIAGWAHRFAAILAVHGCLALPWSYGEGDFFGAGPNREADVSALPGAASALAAHPRCREAGLFGWSRGGKPVLLAASFVADRARIAFAGARAAPDAVREAFDPDAIERFPGAVFPSVGDADELTDPAATRRLAARLAAGRPADVFVARGQGHALDFDTEPALRVGILAFIGRAT